MDDLSADAITLDLGTHIIGRHILYYASLPSTMDPAREAARAGAAEGTAVLAGRQTAGRGRLKRSWLAPEGNIALSVVLYPPPAHLPSLIMLASLGVVHAISAAAGISAAIKWPNDVLVEGRKVCGILIETDVRKDRVAYATIGIGINVSLKPAHFPEIEATAAGLSELAGREISRLVVARRLLRQLDRLYDVLRQGGSLFEEWRDNLVTLGRHVRVTSAEGVHEGMAESVERDGTLVMRCSDGAARRIFAGDVTLRDQG